MSEVTRFAHEGDHAPRGNPPQAHPDTDPTSAQVNRVADLEQTLNEAVDVERRIQDIENHRILRDREMVSMKAQLDRVEARNERLTDIVSGLMSLRERVIALEIQARQLSDQSKAIKFLAKRLTIAEDTLNRVDERVVRLHEDVTEITKAPSICTDVRRPQPLNPSGD